MLDGVATSEQESPFKTFTTFFSVRQISFVGHCPDIIDPCCDVINYTSPFTIPNDTNPFPGWKFNEEINPPEIWPVRTTAFIRWV